MTNHAIASTPAPVTDGGGASVAIATRPVSALDKRISPTSLVPESHRARAHRAAVLAALRQGWRCIYCDAPFAPLGEDITAEHRVPICRAGSRTAENVSASCRHCNVRKGSQTAVEFVTDAVRSTAEESYGITARWRPYTAFEWAYLDGFLTTRERAIFVLVAGYGLTFEEIRHLALGDVKRRSDGQAILHVAKRSHLLAEHDAELIDAYVHRHRPAAPDRSLLLTNARGADGHHHALPNGAMVNLCHVIDERMEAADPDGYTMLHVSEDTLLRTYRAGGPSKSEASAVAAAGAVMTAVGA